MEPNDERVVLYLMQADPDIVVDLLEITTYELMEAFPDKVIDYYAREMSGND